jgi:molybdopterin converting factor small subunit
VTTPAPPTLAALTVTVLLYAHPKELLGGVASVALALPAAARSLAHLRAALLAAHPALAPALPSCAFAAGEALVPRELEAATPAPATVALIPPVSGG